MAMKKKFLGLALATMVAMPATGVYAAGTTQDTQTIENENSNAQVEVTGNVLTKDGQKPQKIEVVLPSKLAFTVNGDGNLDGANCDIENKSTNVDIEVSVDSFTGGTPVVDGSSDGIQVLPADEFETKKNQDVLYRNQIKLSLSKINGTQLDLGSCKKLDATERKLGELKSGETAKLKLTGEAGKKNSTSTSETPEVDSKGAQDNFKLVFSISKK